MTHTLVARLDNAGDVLLAGPAVRAVAAGADRVTFLAGPAGREAAALLPGIDEVLTFEAPWVGFEPGPVRPAAIEALVTELTAAAIDRAVVLTSFHQSPLPLALLLRLARVGFIGATSVDYPGSLLDVRHPYLEGAHEVEQSLSLVGAMGYRLPEGDDGGLRVRRPLPPPDPPVAALAEPYVVVHPGASVPARAMAVGLAADVVTGLLEDGRGVVVTGSRAERGLAANVVGEPRRSGVLDLTGRLDLAGLAAVLDRADAVVCGNTGPAHLAAAVGTPVVEVFAPVVPVERWRPWGVPSVLLGDLDVPCAGCRARTCPLTTQICTAAVTAADVVAAVRRVVRPAPRDVAVPA